MLADVSIGVSSMAIFRTDSSQKRLAAARTTRDSLVERKEVAEAVVAEHREKARALARDGGDDSALAKAEAAMRVQQDRVTTLTAAIGDVEADIAALEHEIAAAADAKLRGETVTAISGMIERWRAAEAEFVRAAQMLEGVSRELSLVCLDCNGTVAFAMSARTELPAVGEVIVTT
jgi:hypothetical protein